MAEERPLASGIWIRVLRSVAADRRDVGKLESHNIQVQQTGQSVPLKQVADIEVVFQPAKILRRDRLKTVTLSDQLQPGYNAIAIAGELEGWLAEQSRGWPVGFFGSTCSPSHIVRWLGAVS